MIDLNPAQVQRIADDLVLYAAVESGFLTDGESYFLSSEQLAEIKNGNDYDFTEIIDELCFHFVFKLMEFNELAKHKGSEQ